MAVVYNDVWSASHIVYYVKPRDAILIYLSPEYRTLENAMPEHPKFNERQRNPFGKEYLYFQ